MGNDDANGTGSLDPSGSLAAERRRRCRAYFQALRDADGDAAAALFSEDGVLDDLMGGQHVGRPGVATFIDRRPALSLEESLYVTVLPDRINHYGLIHFADGVEMKVRWSFSFRDREIAHLGNSRVHYLLGVDA